MPKFIERSITLQLLIFYVLFILPLFLTGAELYSAEHDSWQQQIEQTNVGLDQAVALTIGTTMRSIADKASNLTATSEAKHLDTPALLALFQAAEKTTSARQIYILCKPSGSVVLTYPANARIAEEHFSSQAYFQNALGSDNPIFGSLQSGSNTATQVIPVALRILNQGHIVGVLIIDEPVTALTTQLQTIQQHFPASAAIAIGLIDIKGTWVSSTHDLQTTTIPEHMLPAGPSSSQLVHIQDRDWLYSNVPVAETSWEAIVRQPADIAFAPISNLQHSLLFTLVLLLGGALLFWIVMHGWTVAPLSRLARAVTLIKPNQSEKVTESKLIARERKRADEIGQLIAAFSLMEDEIHRSFRESDAESQARLHTLDAIMQSMYEGVVLENPDGQTVYTNRSFMRFIGITSLESPLSETHMQEKLLTMIVDPTTYQQAVSPFEQASVLEHDEEAPDIEFQTHGYYNSENRWIPVRRDIRVQLFVVRDRAGTLIGRGKIFNDVTRHNEAELVKKNLLAIVSHELRTPLTAIKGYATSLLETDVQLDSTLQQRFLQRIVEEGDRMAELVTNLLEMSQLEAGILKLSSEWHHLRTILGQIVQANEQKPISIHIPADLPAFYIDRRRIEMVIRNLVDNAWCYGGPETIIEIAATYSLDDGLSLHVIDNGPGLPAEQTERIFEHFYQIDSGRKRSKSGVGLGLAICRGFIEAHGGRIWAENRCDGNTGAIFHIWLPPKLLYTSDRQAIYTSSEIF